MYQLFSEGCNGKAELSENVTKPEYIASRFEQVGEGATGY